MLIVGDLVGTDGNKECSYRIISIDKENKTASIECFTVLGRPCVKSTYAWTMELDLLYQVKLEIVQVQQVA